MFQQESSIENHLTYTAKKFRSLKVKYRKMMADYTVFRIAAKANCLDGRRYTQKNKHW